MTARPAAVRLGALPTIGPAVVSLGVFDGVHLGHRAILEATVATAAEQGATAVALVFDPSPDEVLRPGRSLPRLAPLDVNLSRIEAVGVHAVPVRFDEPLSELTAEAFLDSLTPAIDLRGLAMSRRSTFGHNRDGTVERLRELGADRGFTVAVVEPVKAAGSIVSSTRIRATIATGEIEAARRLGVTPYLRGTVVIGDRRGRELGFPTANLRFDYVPAMPSLGIYAGRIAPGVHGVPDGHPSLVSIGTRPTFHSSGDVLVEVHLLDWDGDLYDRQLGVDLAGRLRDERRFSSVEALIEQMRQDAEAGRAALGMT